jgi:deoxyribose-phosphate aldolase
MPTLPASAADLARCIDHTLLSPSAGADAISKLCAEARAHGLFSVCVNPCWVPLAGRALAGSEVAVCTVIGFPLGANSPRIKAAEARAAIEDGADELDMVINVGWLRDGELARVQDDIAGVVAVAGERVVKVILEIALLDMPQIISACELAVAAGARFVKTSTGFGPGGATLEAVAAMRRTVGPAIGVKASGGVRTAADARAMLEAGASRIGASASLAILSGWA